LKDSSKWRDDLNYPALPRRAYRQPASTRGVSPQCGFASHRKGTALTFAKQEAKLKLVVEIAREVWGES
jgi:5-methyltetrahydropteroyltriglutamate--homocysteine methyltransferase